MTRGVRGQLSRRSLTLRSVFARMDPTTLGNSRAKLSGRCHFSRIPGSGPLPNGGRFQAEASAESEFVLQTEHLGLEALQFSLHLMCPSVAVPDLTKNGEILVCPGINRCLGVWKKEEEMVTAYIRGEPVSETRLRWLLYGLLSTQDKRNP